MNTVIKIFLSLLLTICLFEKIQAQKTFNNAIEQNFLHPPESAKPWVFWYWMHAAVSKAGITADLEAMKEVGIGGAYLMPIQDTLSSIPFAPTVRQLTPEWWDMVKFAMQEAKRLNLKLAMHVSDGFALAGGPWITPELSMQKLVWTKTYVSSGDAKIKLPQPESYKGYYKDVSVFAYPVNAINAFATKKIIPSVTASDGSTPQFLSIEDKNNKQSFKNDAAAWIQYKYEQPFTCRSIKIHVGSNNYEAQRLLVQASDDGLNFKTVKQLQAPRHGWQDTDEDVTNAIPATTAKYFRFVYNKAGSEPGAEDLDAAKWKPSLKVMGIYLSDEAVINQYESKNASVWRISENTTNEEVPDAVPLKNIIDITSKMDADGNLQWTPPVGKWVVVRIGHTSTGHTNATGGAGAGLECDKFNPAAIKLQFDNWFGKAFDKNPALAKEVLKIFHVDSWECGSQNWSPVFASEFKKRRGYDMMPYLLMMTGVPVGDAATSEKYLHDVRQTISELISDVFYETLNNLAHRKGCSFTAESVAPTMVSDGLLHYKNVDIPMGEFWLNSPTHDKPNDMLDAISGGHIYGKQIIQSESFTSVRMNWAEHPGNLKALGDRNFALGINKMVLHVFTHNPWVDKKPGMTLDGVGLYFQRDQTWFKQSKAWIDYLTRCSALLQMGKPVVDIAVFTGEEVPRRAVLPDRLVNTLPGIFGKDKIESEKKRLDNIGQPLQQIPDGVTSAANITDPKDWADPLNGYAYDSFNPDALMMMQVENGRVILPGGASYKLLVIPANMKMNPANRISNLSVRKIIALVGDGATVLIDSVYKDVFAANGCELHFKNENGITVLRWRQGKFVLTPYLDSSFEALGTQKDLEILNNDHSIAWVHRKVGDDDIYFITNQKDSEQFINLACNVLGKIPEEYNSIDKTSRECSEWEIKGRQTLISRNLEANESLFIVFRKKGVNAFHAIPKFTTNPPLKFSNKWEVQFDSSYGGLQQKIIFDKLKSWTDFSEQGIKFYSGTAIYRNIFFIDKLSTKSMAKLFFDSVFNVATVKINNIDCGTVWTPSYQLNITKALKKGENKIEILVTNTWHNRLIGDNLLPIERRVTFTTAPFRLKDKPLLPAGIIGDVKIIIWNK